MFVGKLLKLVVCFTIQRLIGGDYRGYRSAAIIFMSQKTKFSWKPATLMQMCKR